MPNIPLYIHERKAIKVQSQSFTRKCLYSSQLTYPTAIHRPTKEIKLNPPCSDLTFFHRLNLSFPDSQPSLQDSSRPAFHNKTAQHPRRLVFPRPRILDGKIYWKFANIPTDIATCQCTYLHPHKNTKMQSSHMRGARKSTHHGIIISWISCIMSYCRTTYKL